MEYDICITGAGTAGCACAYIASNLGLRTVLIEKNNYLGGLMTGGLVVPVMKTDTSNINTEFYEALIKNAKKFGGEIEYFDKNKGWFNPNILKIVLAQMLIDSNAKILLEFTPDKVKTEDNTVKSVVFSSNFSSLEIKSKFFVDSTGDSVLFSLLGEEFINKNSKKQPCSLRFVMSGVNIEELRAFLLEKDKDRNVTNSCTVNGQIHLTTAYTWDKKWNLSPVFEQALKEKDLLPFDCAYFQMFTIAGANSSVALNCPRLKDFNQNNPYERSGAILDAQNAIFRLSKFLIKYFKGFENAYISQIADVTGVRESNNINAKKEYSLSSEILQNPVLSGDYPVDIHSNEKNGSILTSSGKYYMGIDSLISKNYSNLYAAGRNLGADKYARSALRTQANCMSMGEAVARHVFELLNNVN
ncbi:MAG: FAD-dependent oxidoreductase [Candidatus Gastranaerophilales bacterium]|nr:FAD-dependent oxidoreductase [Candidatus Gastranaerophilales bacterium]